MPRLCDTCRATPLDEEGRCVTCDAEAEGLKLLTRSGYPEVREMMSLLELKGLSPEMEKVPPGRPEEKVRPLWNLYVPADEVAGAVEALKKDWAALLADAGAIEAAARGQEGIDLDAGGEVTCPACGHRFMLSSENPKCPECGLGLGVAANAAPDDVKSS